MGIGVVFKRINMKTLYLIRHAKSSWDNENLSDFERPLSKRGLRDAPLMGKLLLSKEIYPDMILSSPANRAKSTAEVIKEEIGFKKDIVFDDSIYHSSCANLLHTIKSLDDKHNIVFMLGHNPSFNSLSYKLSHKDIGNIPTCGIVGIKFNIQKWESLDLGEMVIFEYPKKHI